MKLVKKSPHRTFFDKLTGDIASPVFLYAFYNPASGIQCI